MPTDNYRTTAIESATTAEYDNGDFSDLRAEYTGVALVLELHVSLRGDR